MLKQYSVLNKIIYNWCGWASTLNEFMACTHSCFMIQDSTMIQIQPWLHFSSCCQFLSLCFLQSLSVDKDFGWNVCVYFFSFPLTKLPSYFSVFFFFFGFFLPACSAATSIYREGHLFSSNSWKLSFLLLVGTLSLALMPLIKTAVNLRFIFWNSCWSNEGSSWFRDSQWFHNSRVPGLKVHSRRFGPVCVSFNSHVTAVTFTRQWQNTEYKIV